MSVSGESEASRPRPLSAGLWTLLAWLRRADSADSLSSAGSARSAASFAFLSPAHYADPAPRPRPPPGPPTDSYKKRLHDRNLRRHHDRDLTLHRKYGLYRGDVASLPSARRSAHTNADRQDRERRAISETLQRRTPYVPGKRRAPLPPVGASGSSATLPHRHSRKRRAPQPPTKFEDKIVQVQNSDMNPKSGDSENTTPVDVSHIFMGCKSEKYVKKEQVTTQIKSKQEKSFLKQIFENKKRRSAIETSSVKILPSISELDKQAAEIIETCKLKEREQNNNNYKMDQKQNEQKSEVSKGARWICITCLRRFDVSVNICSFCLSNQKPIDIKSRNVKKETKITQKNWNVDQTSKNIDDEEKLQLKKMLKEMKDSLSKKPKPQPVETIVKNQDVVGPLLDKGTVSVTETPTLRIGPSQHQKVKISSLEEPSSSGPGPSCLRKSEEMSNTSSRDNTNEIVRNILLPNNGKSLERSIKEMTKDTVNSPRNLKRDQIAAIGVNTNKSESAGVNESGKLHTPMKISSLLNPVYVPKQQSVQLPKNLSVSSKNTDKIKDDIILNTDIKVEVKLQNETPIPSTSKEMDRNNANVVRKKIAQQTSKSKITVSTESQTTNRTPTTNKIEEVNQHSRRRDLVNQLEKSIAEGDERAAADAAAKLAQLRLSCSVLSFTSQILGELSNQDAAVQKKETKHENQMQRSEDVLKKPISKCKADNSSRNLELFSETKKDTRPPETSNKQAEQPEQSCSKLPDPNIKPLKAAASTSQESNMVSISVWIEDKNAARGPIKLEIGRSARLGDLRATAERRLRIAARLQRWIVGRVLCGDDAAPLVTLAGPELDAPFYLCLVEFDTKQNDRNKNTTTNKNSNKVNDNEKASDVYAELMQLERQAIVPNGDTFECQVCMEDCPAGHGAVLRECVHSFCRNCLADVIRHCEEPAVPCPATGCPGTLHEREIRALVSHEEYDRWLARGLAAAESGTRNAFHCRTRDCAGWALCEAGVRTFPCPVCKRNNCVPCQAIHEGETCDQYRNKLEQATSQVPNQTDEGTKALLNSLISRGEALECPECSAIITKKWGCDWVKCSACKTEICWVTRGRRWGPAGRGDSSAGCRCGVDGKRCHPQCGYCH